MSNKRWFLKLLMILSLACIIFVGVTLLRINKRYEDANDLYKKLQDFVVNPVKDPEDTKNTEETDTAEQFPQIDFSGLKEINPDVIAWIDIPGICASYPVVKGEDNSYYLSHGFDGKCSISGCLFVDKNNDENFTDQNTIIYGHNMRNKSMFGNLDCYLDKEIYNQQPFFYIYIPGYILQYEIISTYETLTGSVAYSYKFPGSDSYKDFLMEMESNAVYGTGAVVNESSQIVTLSTCVNTKRDYRFVVHGVFIQKIERENVYD